jgi:hypothetical protein
LDLPQHHSASSISSNAKTKQTVSELIKKGKKAKKAKRKESHLTSSFKLYKFELGSGKLRETLLRDARESVICGECRLKSIARSRCARRQ